MAALPYADPDRMAAAGGSYGGYMIDWMLGHTQRFKAFVSHAGVYDLRSEFGATEELWFPLWEFNGTPWDNPDLTRNGRPASYVKDFHTPTLVIHGEQDFRVPYTQGLQLFTALQLQKVPSKLLRVSRRRPLGLEAAEQRAVVQHVSGMDRRVDQTGPGGPGSGRDHTGCATAVEIPLQ